MKEINFYSSKKDYSWLSNFWKCPQIINGISYPTNEHYYQSKKALYPHLQKWIREAPTPYLAMKAGRALRQKNMTYDWDSRKVDIMLNGLRAKFKDPELRQKLLDTGDAVLHEDSPSDIFWGKKGKDMLGKLLMQVRDEIRGKIIWKRR